MISKRSLLIASGLGAVIFSVLIIIDIPVGLGGLVTLRSLLIRRPYTVPLSPSTPSLAGGIVLLVVLYIGGPLAVVTYLAIGVLITLLQAREQPVEIRNAIIDSVLASVLATIIGVIIAVGFIALVRYYEQAVLVPRLQSKPQTEAQIAALITKEFSKQLLQLDFFGSLLRLWLGVIFGSVVSSIGGGLTGLWMSRRRTSAPSAEGT